MIKVSAIHEAALLIAIHVGVVVSTVTLELQTMQYPSDLYSSVSMQRNLSPFGY